MPIYEYVCEADGTVIELMRSMKDADRPAEDPEGRGRRFVRKLSSFAAKSGGSPASRASAAGSLPTACCPCGKSSGQCGRA
ncbi:MAG: FmdB family zinc ribbon protein [Phycisphaerales bacterium]